MVARSRRRSAAAQLPALLTFVLAVLGSQGSNGEEQRDAVVTLRAKWSASPLFQEAAELVADDDSTRFWSFVEASFTGVQPADGDSACWAHVLKLATGYLNPGWAKAAPLVLASRKYSAKVAMFQQVMDEEHPNVQSCCFANVNGVVASSVAVLDKAIKQAASTGPGLSLLPLDHIFPTDAIQPGAVNAVLYAPVGAACAAPLHAKLKEAASSGKLVYALRPTLGKACTAREGSCVAAGGGSEPLLLPGWGMDATAVEPRQVAQVQDLGLQAAQRVLKASDPLTQLVHVSQDLPALAPALSMLEVNNTLRVAVAHNQQYLSPSANYMLVNGLSVDMDELDYFELLDHVQSELKLADRLGSLGLQRNDVQQLLQLRAEDAGDPVQDTRLDLASAAKDLDKMLWLNNLERDPNYEQFSRSVSDVLNAPPGQLRPMRVNVCNFVLVVDPASSDGLVWATTLHNMWQKAKPCRYGLTVKVPAALERLRQQRLSPKAPLPDLAWAHRTISERVALAMFTFEKAYGAYHALIFWIALCTRVTREHTWGVDPDATIKRHFKAQWEAAAVELGRGPNADKARQVQSERAWEDLVAGNSFSGEAAKRLRVVTAWIDSKGIADFEDPVGWLNGRQTPFKTATEQPQVEEQLLVHMFAEQRRVQDAVYFRRLRDGENVQERMLQIAGSVTRWNSKVMENTRKEYVLLHAAVEDPELWALVPHFARGTVASFKADEPEQKPVHAVTHLAVCNVDSKQGRRLAAEALRFLVDRLPSSPSARVLLAFNPSDSDSALATATPSLLETVLHAALRQTPQLSGVGEESSKVTPQFVMDFLSKLLGDEALVSKLAQPLDAESFDEARKPIAELAKKSKLDVHGLQKSVQGLLDAANGASSRVRPSDAMVALRKAHARLARSVLGLPDGASGLVSNGRVVVLYTAPSTQPAHRGSAGGTAPTRALQTLVAEDLDLLTLVSTKYQSAQALASYVQEAYDAGRVELPGVPKGQPRTDEVVARLDDVVAAASAAMSAAGTSEGSDSSKHLQQVFGYLQGPMVQLEPPSGSGNLLIACVLNPLSRGAQRISQVLSALRDSSLAPSIRLVLNPQMDLADMSLTGFYRYALPVLPAGDEALTTAPVPPSASFQALPSQQVLAMVPDVPDAWVVEPAQAPVDLFNARLADAPQPGAVRAELQLSALVLSGSCLDVSASAKNTTSLHGLQLELGTTSTPGMQITSVVTPASSNKSTYFQLHAAPGRWLVSLAPGAPRALFKLVSVSTVLPARRNATGAAVAHADFSAEEDLELALNPRSAQILVSSLAGRNVALRVRTRPSKAGNKLELQDAAQAEAGMAGGGSGARLHVFSVAAGHVSERLQRAMMLSVLNHTQAPVKFWMVAGLASAHHKQVVPRLAKEFGFEFEFVSYKWPAWLRTPADKQHEVWADKVLFLDVLFPESVERVVVADPDQVVRADLRQVAGMDLQGKVWAFAPQCENPDRPELDKLKPWNQNAWVKHLNKKSFYAGALAVVDVARLRASGAGNALRVLYKQMHGRGMLVAAAPADVALPSYAQHQLGVAALPGEWAWCEAWCSAAAKEQAKSWAACSSSQEPRLSAAMRLLDQWPGYDQMQAKVAGQVDAELGFAQGVSMAQASVAAAEARASFATMASAEVTDMDEPAASPPEKQGHGVDATDALLGTADASGVRQPVTASKDEL